MQITIISSLPTPINCSTFDHSVISIISFGTFTHIILDAMCLTPKTFLWPLYGLSFERYELINLSYLIQAAFHILLIYRAICVPELLGATIIIWFVWLLVRRGNFYAFLRNGLV